MKKLAARLLILVVIGYALVNEAEKVLLTTNNHIASNTLLIMGASGGGTGVILNSSPITSEVLTNKHVCEAIKHMGTVINDSGQSFSIINFRESNIHDLCDIIVVGNLKGHVDLAPRPPYAYEEAIIAGHPRLMPTVINRGHFTHHTIINVQGEGKPLESQLVTAMISPGSSGSAVYNTSGELAGMVFAGAGEIGFAMIVPQEFIKVFLTEELYRLDVQVITPEVVDPVSSLIAGVLPPNRAPTQVPKK